MMDNFRAYNLVGVHPDLVHVIKEARKRTPFVVTCGLRTIAEQRELFRIKATRLNPDNPKHILSRHLTGHAVDIAVLHAGKVTWHWPLYEVAAVVIKQVAKECGVSIVWGGDWRTFRDGPHYELDRNVYPDKEQ
jgi:peptidoglycan L-alanyl-D-glutamate endopeptidase CwlK